MSDLEDDAPLPTSLLESDETLKCYFCPVRSNDRDTLTFHLVHTHWKKVKKRLAEAAEKSDAEEDEPISVNPEFAKPGGSPSPSKNTVKKTFMGPKSKRKVTAINGVGETAAKKPRAEVDSERVEENSGEQSRNLEEKSGEGDQSQVDGTTSI